MWHQGYLDTFVFRVLSFFLFVGSWRRARLWENKAARPRFFPLAGRPLVFKLVGLRKKSGRHALERTGPVPYYTTFVHEWRVYYVWSPIPLFPLLSMRFIWFSLVWFDLVSAKFSFGFVGFFLWLMLLFGLFSFRFRVMLLRLFYFSCNFSSFFVLGCVVFCCVVFWFCLVRSCLVPSCPFRYGSVCSKFEAVRFLSFPRQPLLRNSVPFCFVSFQFLVDSSGLVNGSSGWKHFHLPGVVCGANPRPPGHTAAGAGAGYGGRGCWRQHFPLEGGMFGQLFRTWDRSSTDHLHIICRSLSPHDVDRYLKADRSIAELVWSTSSSCCRMGPVLLGTLHDLLPYQSFSGFDLCHADR